MGEIYESAETLLERGEVYYSVIIQANTILFNENLYLLQNTVHYIYSFKNRDDEIPSSIKAIEVSDEYQRDFNIPIVMSEIIEPDENNEFTEQLRKSVLYTNTIMVFRKYTPYNCIILMSFNYDFE